MPAHLIRQDIEILKRMGANAVRGHYPPSEMFVDFCDENGLFLLFEVPSWQYRPDQLANPVCKEKIKRQFDDMVYGNMNRPSVFSWSLGNEWRQSQQAYDDIKELVDHARTVDATHFITFITGGAHTDRATELLDIVCTNWTAYPWYSNPSYNDGNPKDYEAPTVLNKRIADASIGQLEQVHQRFPNKPVVVTEFGGAESQAGWHNWGNVKWSEEYQARSVWDSGKYVLEQDWISGGCVWQFCETRAVPMMILGARFRGWNAKGVVDAYRQPKLAFYKLQELFRSHARP
jgi:beta-glucuronidase